MTVYNRRTWREEATHGFRDFLPIARFEGTRGSSGRSDARRGPRNGAGFGRGGRDGVLHGEEHAGEPAAQEAFEESITVRSCATAGDHRRNGGDSDRARRTGSRVRAGSHGREESGKADCAHPQRARQAAHRGERYLGDYSAGFWKDVLESQSAEWVCEPAERTAHTHFDKPLRGPAADRKRAKIGSHRTDCRNR